MNVFIALYRHVPANRVIKGLLVSATVYGLYLIYVGLFYVRVPNGLKDPVYRLTGVPRTEQIVSVSVLFGIAVMAALIWHLARDGRPFDFASSRAAKRGTALIVALLFLNGVAASLAAVLDELSSQFWLPLFAWTAAVLALQIVIVYAGLLRIKQSWLHPTLMGALSAFNLFALYLSLLGDFHRRSDLIQIAIVIFVLLAFVVLFALAGKRVVAVRSINTVLVVTMIGPVAALALSSSTAPIVADRLAPFSAIEFRSKPNIHIVSVDALSPASLAQKHMGLSDLPYEHFLADDGATLFKNAFASQVPTRQSLNSLMHLAHPDFAGDFGYFAGRTDGPVTHILRSNGYTISTGFDQQYFGGPGPFVDAYIPEPSWAVRNSTLCALASDDEFKFFGFCTFGSIFAAPAPEEIWPDRVIDIVRRAAGAPDTMPAFTLHYIVNPIGHTALGYRSSDREALAQYAEVYRNGAMRIAAIMERLQETVRNAAAPAILIVMGDHGSFLSRTVTADQDPDFVVQDRYGIFASVLVNTTGCTAQQLQHYTKIYATPERILAGVMRCLARDPARMDAAVKFDEAYQFEKFLYE